jgi:PKD repeat protein
LTVSNGCGSDIYTRLNDFTVYQVPNASFSGAPTLGDAPLGVNFIDSSLGSPIQWNWTFGDDGNSSMQNPSHTYLTVGTYNVSLSISTVNGCINTTTQPSYIAVGLHTIFTASPRLGDANLSVQFSDTSLGEPNSWLWLFGDGSISIDQNPNHVYSQAGTFDVN